MIRRFRRWNVGDKTSEHWEDARVNAENIPEVLAGLKPLRRQFSSKQRTAMSRLLDGGNMGRSEDVAIVNTGPEGRSILDIKGDDKQARVVSVSLITQLPPDPLPFLIAPLAGIALVEWGNSGVQAQAELDFINGTSFSVPCSFLRINVIRDGVDDAGFDTATTRYGAFVSYEPLPGGIPQRTLNNDDSIAGTVFPIAPAGIGFFIIPRFAKEMYLYRRATLFNLPPPAVQIEFTDATFASITAEDKATGEDWNFWVPIPNDARFVRLRNAEAGGGLSIGEVRLVFRLGL